MNAEMLQKTWKKWLIDIGKSETNIAEERGKKQQNLNRTIRQGSIKYIELSEIVEKYGYSIDIHKK